MLRFLTAGESHGHSLTAIVEGIPAGFQLTSEYINKQLTRRQGGYGRGGRMKIEQDKALILSGVRKGETIGSPIALQIENRDWKNWQAIMSPNPSGEDDLGECKLPEKVKEVVTKPRPGHADLAGMLKYNHRDMRNVLERASARETAARVAVGSVARAILEQLGVNITSHVTSIGHVSLEADMYHSLGTAELQEKASLSQVSCIDEEKSAEMMVLIDRAKADGDSLGGTVEVVAENVPPGLGSYTHWDRKLDARLAQSLMSIQAIKGVEFGMGFTSAKLPGSKVHDPINYNHDEKRFYHETNNAGGIEGGMSNGEPIIARIAMKPIPTLYKPLQSVDVVTKEEFPASVERSDCCAVPACAVVAEAAVAWELAVALIEKVGGDSFADINKNLKAYLDRISQV